MSDRMRQIMLEYIRLYSPVSHVNEEELEYNETENLVELIHEKANIESSVCPEPSDPSGRKTACTACPGTVQYFA